MVASLRGNWCTGTSLKRNLVGNATKGNVWLHNRAYQGQATFVFFGASASYDYTHVETPMDLSAGHFGALELALRVGHLDLDTSAIPTYATITVVIPAAIVDDLPVSPVHRHLLTGAVRRRRSVPGRCG